MSWEERVREAAYTSPGGTRIVFKYEDVSREFDKRGTAFEFPGVNDAYVQQRSFGPRKYPLRCYFAGPDHDLSATAFEVAVLEDGPGKLEHPLYGPVTVAPLGTVTRRDDLKTGANQTIIELTFWTTLSAIYPSSQAHPQSEVLSALQDFDTAAAQQFADNTNLVGPLNQGNGKATTRSLLQNASKALGGLPVSNRNFLDLHAQISLGLDVLITDPATLAAQVGAMIRAPGEALTGAVQTFLDAYSTLSTAIFGTAAGRPAAALATGSSIKTRRTKAANDFHLADLFAMQAVGGSIASVVATTFSTKPQALTAAVDVLAQFDTVVAWRDDGFDTLGAIDAVGTYQVDTGASYQALQRAAALAAGFLIQISFSLVPERRIVLDRPRTIIDLCAELYGSVDNDRLDFIISSNDLTGSEILELERGKTIAYYN